MRVRDKEAESASDKERDQLAVGRETLQDPRREHTARAVNLLSPFLGTCAENLAARLLLQCAASGVHRRAKNSTLELWADLQPP